MEEREKIVVFRGYESVMDANVAKTKLDAYGIPCFLAQEHMNTLMAHSSFLFTVRLHVFQSDIPRVKEILDEEYDRESPVTCPKCESTEIDYRQSQKKINRFSAIAFSMLFQLNMWVIKAHHCRVCNYEF